MTIEMQGKVYNADKAVAVAEQLQAADQDGWKYVAELKDGFGRVQVFDEAGEMVGIY